MDPKLTRAEYWLLETVVEFPRPLYHANPEIYQSPNGIEEHFNKPGHGLNREQLVATFEGLFQNGLIEATMNDQSSFFLDRTQIASALEEYRGPGKFAEGTPTYYQLTAIGGATWEAFAAPEWDRYIKEGPDAEAMEGEITSMTPWRLDHYLQLANVSYRRVDFTTIQREKIGPWEALYWKILPHGSRTRFRWLENISEDITHDNYLLRLAFSGFCDYREAWYRWR